MRVFSAVIAIVLALCVMSALVFAQSSKNICVGKLTSGANPAAIPPAALAGMTNRGQGNYTLAVSICSAIAAPGACSKQGAGYVAVSNTTGCDAAFDTVLQRPTVSIDGFSVKYGSTVNAKDTFELMVLCHRGATSDALISRSNKFAVFTPNKLGGRGFMAAVFSAAACGNHTIIPTHHSELPSGGSSDLPSGGSSDLPSGNSSDIPSGGSSSNLPSGSSNMPSGGSNSDIPSSSASGSPSAL